MKLPGAAVSLWLVVMTTLWALSAAAAPQNQSATIAADYPPERGLVEGDSTGKRLLAVRRDLTLALDTLGTASREAHGAHVSRSIAAVQEALAEVQQAQRFVAANPATDRVDSWPKSGAMPVPLPQLPQFAGVQQMSGGRISVVPLQGDATIVKSFAHLRHAFFDMLLGPGTDPYQIGEIGGHREAIRDDIRNAATALIAGLDYARELARPRTASAGSPLVNGGFEAPAAPVNGPVANRNLMITTIEGREPDGLEWRVRSGSAWADSGPTILRTGYTNTAKDTPRSYPGAAAEGLQWIVLAGGNDRSTEGAAIRQTVRTTPGQRYAISFAYGSGPRVQHPAHLPPLPDVYSATLRVTDLATEQSLMNPVTFSKAPGNAADYGWTRHPAVTFTATGALTAIEFRANDVGMGLNGLFLDDVVLRTQ